MPSSADDLRSLLNEGGRAPRADRRSQPASGRGATDAAALRDRLSETGRRSSRAGASDRTIDIGQERRSRPSNDRSQRGGSRRRSDDETIIDARSTDLREETSDPSGDGLSDSSDLITGARPSSTLQQAWIDPAEMPFEPVPRPGNPLTARLIAWIGVAFFLAGLGWLIIPELDLRLQSLEIVNLEDGVLTAQPVQLAPIRAAIVSELYVDASRLPDGVLAEGTPIALLEGTSQDGTRQVLNEMVVPFDARFVSVDTLVGGVVMPGTPVATVYDPSKMYVIVTVRPELLDIMRRGMRARLISDVADVEIEGEVISAVPLLGTDHEPTTANLVNIRIKPDPEGIADLVPGIRFDAMIDLSSAPANAQPLVFTYAGHIDANGDAADENGS